MCMHWLKYVRLNREGRLKSMHGTTLEVPMPVDVSEVHSTILSVYWCVTGPQRHEPSLLPLGVLETDWSIKR